MTVNKTTMWLAACFLIAIGSTPASAQFDDFVSGEADHEMQFFAPLDFDFDMQPVQRETGWFFSYDKLSWAAAGDRTEIGDPNVVVLSEDIYPQTPTSTGTPVPQYVVRNSIQDAPPEASFAWGERYEFGTIVDGHRWSVGILDGPEINSYQKYGFNQLTIPNRLPLAINMDDNFADLGFDLDLIGFLNAPLPGTGSADITTTTNGFGSVHVNFITPAGYLRGFRDYSINIIGPNGEVGQGPTGGGPGYQVVGLTIDGTGITDVTLLSGGDGIVDNLDGDALNGFFFIGVDTDGDGTIDVIVADGVDYDDLHTFNIAFDSLDVRSTTETQGVELMYTLDLGNKYKMVKHQNNRASFGYGVRYLRLRDSFYWEGKGSILGRTYADTEAQNSIFGPQIRGNWSSQQGRWNVSIDGRCTLGYNVQDIDQIGAIGESLAPGAPNRPASAQPNAIANGRTDNDFSPLVEFRAETSYQITSSIAARLGYTAIFVDNITRSSQIQRWELPNLGTTEGGQQDIFINGANFGFDIVY